MLSIVYICPVIYSIQNNAEHSVYLSPSSTPYKTMLNILNTSPIQNGEHPTHSRNAKITVHPHPSSPLYPYNTTTALREEEKGKIQAERKRDTTVGIISCCTRDTAISTPSSPPPPPTHPLQ
jgi:hypothetical protein